MAEVNSAVHSVLGYWHASVVCWTHARASPNMLAITYRVTMHDFSFDMPCRSHTFDHIVDHMKSPKLDLFFQPFNHLCSMSSKAVGQL